MQKIMEAIECVLAFLRKIPLSNSSADNEMKRKVIESVSVMTGSVSPEAEEATWDGNEEMIKRLLGLG